MRSKLTLVAVSSAVVLLGSCSGDSSDSTPSPTQLVEQVPASQAQEEAPGDIWEVYYAPLLERTVITHYSTADELLSQSDLVVAGHVRAIERGRTHEVGGGAPPVEFVELTIDVDSLSGSTEVIVELPVLPTITPEIRAAQEEFIDFEAVSAARTDEEVEAAVDVEALDKRLAELYEDSIDASVAALQDSAPSGRHLFVLVESENGRHQLLSPNTVLQEVDGELTAPMTGHGASPSLTELLALGTIDEVLKVVDE